MFIFNLKKITFHTVFVLNVYNYKIANAILPRNQHFTLLVGMVQYFEIKHIPSSARE
jgi:hypothetical protein